MALTIRSARLGEIDAVMALLKELDEAHVDLEPKLLQHFKGAPRPREWLELRFADSSEACLVADLDGTVAGFIWCKSQLPPSLPAFIQEPVLIIGDLIVREAMRGRGIGRALLDAALDWGRARGLKRAQLTVFERNEVARSFYAELEFRPLSVVLMREL